jgi:hypothetical protein
MKAVELAVSEDVSWRNIAITLIDPVVGVIASLQQLQD